MCVFNKEQVHLFHFISELPMFKRNLNTAKFLSNTPEEPFIVFSFGYAAQFQPAHFRQWVEWKL
jgi:hypothetical protein